MLLAALLAMVMAAAAPAFAQTAVGGDTAVLQYSCNEIQAALNVQYQQGEGTGAVAGAAQSLGVNQNQVLACFGTAVAAQQSTINAQQDTVNLKDDVVTVSATSTAKGGGGGGGGSASGSASAAAGGALPETGGASLIALGAGALLVAGGLLARRIVR
jgi:hypothetical protein